MSRSDDTKPIDSPTSKRKRDIIPVNEEDKLEIQIGLPEPPSKKAKRKEKKASKKKAEGQEDTKAEHPTAESAPETTTAVVNDDVDVKTTTSTATAPRPSAHGIWIGNLPFKATKDSLRSFLLDHGGIDEQSITRLHMPTAEKGQNKGFAYIDFSTPAVLEIALKLSEKLLLGRRVLIKDATSFAGRPKKEDNALTAGGSNSSATSSNGKEPSKRVFVGNLGFDVTRDELAEHFAPAGEIEDVFMATFEDTGKCKGFAWVRFATVEAASNAVKGFVMREQEQSDPDDDDSDDEDGGKDSTDPSATKPREPAKKRKPRKWFLNRIHGRTLRCEFAEDAQTRYKKRFGSSATRPAHASNESQQTDAIVEAPSDAPPGRRSSRLRKLDKHQRQDERRKVHDARKIAPGRALANAQRATGAIVAGAGTKKTFE